MSTVETSYTMCGSLVSFASSTGGRYVRVVACVHYTFTLLSLLGWTDLGCAVLSCCALDSRLLYCFTRLCNMLCTLEVTPVDGTICTVLYPTVCTQQAPVAFDTCGLEQGLVLLSERGIDGKMFFFFVSVFGPVS